MATIQDVAVLAGVSTATVSRVFNGLPVSDERTARVRKAAAALRFVPNRAARTLRRQNAEVIALVIPDIENPFFPTLARGVEDVAKARGYSVVLCNSDEDPAKEASYLGIAASENMAGVIIAPRSPSLDLSTFLQSDGKVVSVYNRAEPNIDAVLLDDWNAGASATSVLIQAGYRRIAYLGGPRHVATAGTRAEAWRDTVARGVPGFIANDYYRATDLKVEGGYLAMRDLLASDDPPDAVLAGNNLTAVGALRALREAGLAPPAFGVAVIGDLPFATIDPGSVTQVHLPARELGTTAATVLLDRIDGDAQPPRDIVLSNRIEPALRPPSPELQM
ncbi:LacI family DNA-binding transcriptional regulator [soil metagenome]